LTHYFNDSYVGQSPLSQVHLTPDNITAGGCTPVNMLLTVIIMCKMWLDKST